MKTITIIGGGLAGLGLGNGLLKRGVPVRLIEAGQYPRHVVCGEFLAGLKGKVVENLGIEDVFEGAIEHKSVAWIKDGEVMQTFQLPEKVKGISRFVLDFRLAELFKERGGILETNVRWKSGFEEGVIDCTGRKIRKPNGFIGLKAHFIGLKTLSDLEMHLGRNAYIGLSQVENATVNVCGLFREIARGKFDTPTERFSTTLKLHGLNELEERLSFGELKDGSYTSVAGLGYDLLAETDTITGGAAWQSIPPYTGNGMALALETAEIQLAPLVLYANGSDTWKDTVRICSKTRIELIRDRLKWAQRFHPFLLNETGQKLSGWGARKNLIPFKQLYRLTH